MQRLTMKLAATAAALAMALSPGLAMAHHKTDHNRPAHGGSRREAVTPLTPRQLSLLPLPLQIRWEIYYELLRLAELQRQQ